MSYTKRRYFKTTKGENAEVIVGKAVAYTTQGTIALFEANAVVGEVGIYDGTTNTLLGGPAILAAPGNPAVSTSTVGGALAATTYFYKIVALNAAGNSAGSVEVSQTTSGSTSSNQLSWNDVPGATSYRVYRGTTTNVEDHYQVSGSNTFLDQGAVGTAGTVPAAAGTTAAPLVAGQKFYTAIMYQVNNFGVLQNQLFKTTTTVYDATRTRRTAYIAPVKQVSTITVSAALVTALNAAIAAQPIGSLTDQINYASITTIETTPGNEPYPTIDFDYEFSNPAGVTVSAILTNIVARINNPLDIVQKDDGQQYSAVLAGNDGAGYTIAITSFYFQQHFRIALRGLFENATVVYTTPYKQGVGDSVSVGDIEREGFIFAGVTTNYPGLGIPAEYGEPDRMTVDGLTYVTYQLDPLRISKEPMPQSVHHHWAHLYIIVPVAVGGDAPTRAASSPDYIIGTTLGFVLTP